MSYERWRLIDALERSRRLVSSIINIPDDESWPAYGGSADSYGHDSFAGILGDSKVTDHVAARAQMLEGRKPFILDFMASTAAIVSLDSCLQSRGLPGVEGIALSLNDARRPADVEKEAAKGIHHVAGDLGHAATWGKLRKQLDGKKADFILEAGILGLSYVPNHKGYYAYALNQMWSMLDPNEGTMILEVPYNTRLRTAGLPVLRDIELDLSDQGVNITTGTIHRNMVSALYAWKTPDSPQRLEINC